MSKLTRHELESAKDYLASVSVEGEMQALSIRRLIEHAEATVDEPKAVTFIKSDDIPPFIPSRGLMAMTFIQGMLANPEHLTRMVNMSRQKRIEYDSNKDTLETAQAKWIMDVNCKWAVMYSDTLLSELTPPQTP